MFETRLGCLNDTIPERTQSFITATQDMMVSSLYVLIGERLHQRFQTRFWKRHEQAWDKMFKIGKRAMRSVEIKWKEVKFAAVIVFVCPVSEIRC